MSLVRVEPSGITFDSEPGETIMGAAVRNGFWWPTICGGNAECAVCAVVVVDGGQHLGAIDADEARMLPIVPEAMLHPDSTVRLACQARIDGDVVLTKRGVRPATR